MQDLLNFFKLDIFLLRLVVLESRAVVGRVSLVRLSVSALAVVIGAGATGVCTAEEAMAASYIFLTLS